MVTERSLRILLVDDEGVIQETLGSFLRAAGQQVDDARDGRAAVQAVEACRYDLTLVALEMSGLDAPLLAEKLEKVRPGMPVITITGRLDLAMAVHVLRLAAAAFLTKAGKLAELDAVLEKSLRLSRLHGDNRRLRGAIRGIQALARDGTFDGRLVGNSPATQKVRQQIHELVEARCETILITGETGTGKEVVAREIHFQAASPEDPFVAVSCPALPDSLVESELFGHAKGAFTGAEKDRIGYFEMANGSTLLLDEAWGSVTGRPGQDPPRAGDPQPATRGRLRRHCHPGASDRRYQRLLGRLRCRGAVPARPLLPAQRLQDSLGTAPRAPRGHPAPGRAFPGGFCGAAESSARRLLGGRQGQAPGLRLPRQRPRTPLPVRAGRHAAPVRPDPCGRRPVAGRGACAPPRPRPTATHTAARSSAPWKESTGTAGRRHTAWVSHTRPSATRCRNSASRGSTPASHATK